MGYAASVAEGSRGIDRDAPFHGMTPRWLGAVDGVDPNGVSSAITPLRVEKRERGSAYVSQCHGARWSGDRVFVDATARPPRQGRDRTAADRRRYFDARLTPSFAHTVPEMAQTIEMDTDVAGSARTIHSCRPRGGTASFGGQLSEGTGTDPMIQKKRD